MALGLMKSQIPQKMLRNSLLHCLYAILFLLPHLSHAQLHDYIHYTIDDGLPTNYVYGVVEDRQGSIWAYTEHGLSKFDGYSWQNFNVSDGLPDNDAHTVFADAEGIIHGIAGEKQFIVENDTIKANLLKAKLVEILEGQAYYNFSESINTIKYQNGELIDVSAERDSTINILNDLISIVCQSLNISDRNNFYDLNPHGYRSIYSNGVVILYFLNGKDNIVYSIDNISKKIGPVTTRLLVESGRFFQLKTHVDGYSLVNENGALFFDRSHQKLDSIFYSDIKELKQYNILNTSKDQNGNVWIGTRNNGLLMIPSRNRNIEICSGTQEVWIEALEVVDEHSILYISDSGVVTQYDGDKSSQLIPSVTGSRLRNVNRLTENQIAISDNQRTHIIKLPELSILKQQSAKFGYNAIVRNNAFLNNINLVKDRCHYFAYDELKKIYFLSNSLITLYTDDIVNSTYYQMDKAVPHRFSKTKKGEVICYNESSIFFISDDMQLIEHKLGLGHINCVYEYSENSYIVSVEDVGLFKWDKSNNISTKIADDGTINKIREVNDSIMLCAYGKVYTVNENLDLKEFVSTKDGLPSPLIYDIIYFKNQYYIATSSGLCKLSMRQTSIQESNYTIPISIKGTDGQGNALTKHINLKHYQNDVKMTIGAQHYASNGDFKYEYKLSPEDEQWQSTDQREINYIDLRPGEYEFAAKVTDRYGVAHFSDSLEFKIAPKLLQRDSVRIGLGLLAGLIIFLILERRERQRVDLLNKESKINQRMADLQLTALRSQMNPHFIFNALGSIQYYINSKETQKADAYLTSFAKLMRMYLDSSSERMISVAEEVELLKLYVELEQMRYEDKFNVEFEIDESLLQEQILIPSMIIQPIVENAFKHGLLLRTDGNSRLSIKFQKTSAGLKIEIIDNGIGFNSSQKTQSHGYKSRASQMIKEKNEILESLGLAKVYIQHYNAFQDDLYPGTKVEIIVIPLS